MSIIHLPQQGFPFGNNIHFAYQPDSAQFLYLHPSLRWITAGGAEDENSGVLKKIEAEDLIYLQDMYEKVRSGKFNGKLTFKLAGPSGLKWLLVVPVLAEHQGDKLICGTVIDVTDEMRNLQLLTKYTDKKNSILHMLGHDLRGPLNIARSLVDTVASEIENPVHLEKTKHIAMILEQSIDMISDLVKREFLETVNAEIVKRRVDIVKLLRDYLEECKKSEELSGISFHLFSSPERVFIQLDEAKFMQVVNNLISNSLKFTPAGGSISITVEEQSDQVKFMFTDTGIGIPKELLSQVFEKFTPARRPGLQGEPTLGLGLSIVKTIIDWHGGTVRCESKEGSGTTVVVTLPL